MLSKEDKIATPVGVTGKNYTTTICGKQKLIKSQREEITCEVLVEAIRDVW